MEVVVIGTHVSWIDLLPEESLVDLQYADDIVILREDADKMQSILNGFARNPSRLITRFTCVKCKIMQQDWSVPTSTSRIQSEMVQCVHHFTYSGSCINSSALMSDEISALRLPTSVIFGRRIISGYASHHVCTVQQFTSFSSTTLSHRRWPWKIWSDWPSSFHF